MKNQEIKQKNKENKQNFKKNSNIYSKCNRNNFAIKIKSTYITYNQIILVVIFIITHLSIVSTKQTINNRKNNLINKQY